MMTDLDTIDQHIAIIGMTGRFPQASDLETFWQHLRDGVEAISFFSDEELLAAGVDPALVRDPNYVKARGVVDQIEMFDAAFFGYSPREAEIMDPQQRVFLECAWEALEHAGYDAINYPGPIGLYAGVGMNNYFLLNLYSKPALIESVGLFPITLSNDRDFLTTRVSYKLNLRGPSMNIQTACSTSLVGVHLACQSLLNAECDLALAGGVALKIPQISGYQYHEGGIASPDGHCRSYDARASGTLGSSGVGVVVLKRLTNALADGDTIHAVIRSSAINNDGLDKVGYTAPSINGQARVIADALAIAEVEPATIGLVEGHGSGTVLGDPIEVAALNQVFRASTDNIGFCALGSVKTNIGHLDVAAGMAGLIKTVLALKHKQIPPSLHFEQPNPAIDFANSPFFVPTETRAWPAADHPRRAGVSSFGIGGTNAHLVLEEAPPMASNPSPLWQLLVLSAQTGSALEAATERLAAHLEQHPELELADAAYTLQVGRHPFKHRRAILARDRGHALQALRSLTADQAWSQQAKEDAPRPIVFLIPGVGDQYQGMAADLYSGEPVFRKTIDRCCVLLKPLLGRDLRDVLFPPTAGAAPPTKLDFRQMVQRDGSEPAAGLLNQTIIVHPAQFIVSYALARLWMSWGIRPQLLLGYSLGEYVAACLAGVFSLEDALHLVVRRAQLIQEQPAGSMLAVPLPEARLRPLLESEDGSRLALVAINGPSLSVAAGSAEEVRQLEQRLAAQGIAGQRVAVSHAFHSPQLEPLMDAVAEAAARITLHPPRIRYLSNVTGTWITDQQATDPRYWAAHMCRPVQWAAGLEALWAEQPDALIELGPGQTLLTLARQHPSSARALPWVGVSALQARYEPGSDRAVALAALGKTWLHGLTVDWPKVHSGERRRRVALPAYPFERQRYWIDAQPGANPPAQRADRKQYDLAKWFYAPVWQQIADTAGTAPALTPGTSWLIFQDDHGVGAEIVKRLRMADQVVVQVSIGSGFTRLDSLHYAIEPGCREDYTALLSELKALDCLPRRIVHLWNITEQAEGLNSLAQMVQRQDRSFYSLLYLAQVCGEQQLTAAIDLKVVSNQIHHVTGDEQLCPEKITLLGPCKTIPKEYPHIRCQSIDLMFPTSGPRQQEWQINRLLAEVAGDSTNALVAYRGRQRWVQRFEPIQLDPLAGSAVKLRAGGVYLITGGLGGIGLALAQEIAQTVQARLVLISRSGLPERDQWAEWLATHPADDRLSRKIQQIQALESLGAEVLVVAADVADPEQMRSAIARTREQFGAVNGLIHAAGIAGGSLMQLQTRERTAQTLASKLQGTYLLHTLLAEDPLDVIVLCSSLNAILGVPGRVDYCAANAFLDAFAHWKSERQDVPTISINWDVWTEAGMAVDAGHDPADEGILSAEGRAAFRRILQHPLPQVVVSTRDFGAVLDQNQAFTAARYLAELGHSAGDVPLHARPQLRTAFVAPRDEIEQTIAGLWQHLLGIDQVGVDDSLFELGGNSLLGLQLTAQIYNALHVRLDLAVIFEAPTVAEQARLVARALLEQIESLPTASESEGATAPTGPRDVFEEQLLQIFVEVLPGRAIGIADDFFALGGDWTIAEDLMRRVRRRFGWAVPIAVLEQGPTIEYLARVLRHLEGSVHQQVTMLRDLDMTGDPGSLVVEVQPGQDRPPFFCVTYLGGIFPPTVFGLIGLAQRMGTDQPLYGIQPPTFRRDLLGYLDPSRQLDDQIIRSAIEEWQPNPHMAVDVAAQCVAAMRAVQPRGPYYLGGVCTGGVLAFEIAQQLRTEGEQVGLLVLLDSPAPIYNKDAIQIFADSADEQEVALLAQFAGWDLGGGRLAKNLRELYDALIGLEPQDRWAFITERATQAGVVGPETTPDQIRRLYYIFKANGGVVRQVARSYQPRPYEDQITLFKVAEVFQAQYDDPTNGWSRLSTQQVDVQIVPGDHGTMLKDPHVHVLAQHLRDRIDRAVDQA